MRGVLRGAVGQTEEAVGGGEDVGVGIGVYAYGEGEGDPAVAVVFVVIGWISEVASSGRWEDEVCGAGSG